MSDKIKDWKIKIISIITKILLMFLVVALGSWAISEIVNSSIVEIECCKICN